MVRVYIVIWLCGFVFFKWFYIVGLIVVIEVGIWWNNVVIDIRWEVGFI